MRLPRSASICDAVRETTEEKLRLPSPTTTVGLRTSVFTVGIALWLVYGLALGAWPIVLANAITLALAGAILAMKLRYGRRSGSTGCS